jgi:hypothetical protein
MKEVPSGSAIDAASSPRNLRRKKGWRRALWKGRDKTTRLQGRFERRSTWTNRYSIEFHRFHKIGHLHRFTPIPLLCTLAFDSQDGVEGHDGMAAGD